MTDVVLLHGWGMSSIVFEPLAHELAHHCVVHALDLPGYNGAPVCESHTLDLLADYVARAAPQGCVAIGWSLGALVALAWALLAPAQVQRLVLVGATPCFARTRDWTCAVAPEVLRSFAESVRSDRKGALRRFIALQALDDEHAPSVSRALQAAQKRSETPAAGVLENGLRILLEADLRPLLAQIEQPALVVHGERDRLVPLAAGTYLAQTLPNAQLEVVPGAAHAPFVRYARRIAQRVAGLLNG